MNNKSTQLYWDIARKVFESNFRSNLYLGFLHIENETNYRILMY